MCLNMYVMHCKSTITSTAALNCVCMCQCVFRSSRHHCVCMCDSAMETGEGDVEKFLVGGLVLLLWALRTGGGGEKRHIIRCLRHHV